MLETAMKETGFVGWLRNLPRRDWAMCIPYELGGTRAFFPDLVIVRKKGKGFDVDLIEPHDDTRTDTGRKQRDWLPSPMHTALSLADLSSREKRTAGSNWPI